MFAIIKTGGKQYKVAEGDLLLIEKLELGIGDKHEFNEVLLVSDGEKTEVGSPLLAGKKVSAEVVDQARAKKVRIIKFRRRKHSMTRQGHRQYYTAVRITAIA